LHLNQPVWSFSIIWKVGNKEVLTAQEQEEWNRVGGSILFSQEGHKRCNAVIDGEERMQDAADDLVTSMMRKYNKDKPCFNTANVPLGSIDFKRVTP
jgi:proline dehydrogenase